MLFHFLLQRLCIKREKRPGAHPVWKMLKRSEMIRFKYNKILVDEPLPEDLSNKAELDEYTKQYGKQVYKEFKVRFRSYSDVLPSSLHIFTFPEPANGPPPRWQDGGGLTPGDRQHERHSRLQGRRG